ncbi:MAG: hypothetical protein ACOC1P_00830 [Minisyncoccales bacterium]
MDVVSIPETSSYYRILLSTKGKLFAFETTLDDSKLLPLWIKNKTVVKGGKIQLNFSNGFVLNVDKDEYKTGDVILYDYLAKKIVDKFSLQKDAFVFFISGKHKGESAIVKEVNEENFVFKLGEEIVNVDKKNSKLNAFVLGKKKSSIKIN